MSITARTAGFNTVPMDSIQPGGRFVLMTLMLVGGSPGGTAGGTKTTTIALLLLSVWATVRRRAEGEAFGRQLSDTLVRKAATYAACYLGLIMVGILLLSLTEPQPFSHITFEVISAATTTGLSLGITDSLTTFGRCVVIALMFLGRVGPLTLLGSVIIGGALQRPYAYPHEDVPIG